MKYYNDYIVNLKKLKNNVLNIKNRLNKDVKFCAIVKANAYGLGAENICKSLYGIADFFAVAIVDEALNIRKFDKTTKVLVLGVSEYDDLSICSDNNISISIGSIIQLNKLKNINKPINIHLQINTGLNRYGFRSITEFGKALKIIKESKYIKLEGVYSHFATKENDTEFINKQFLRFLSFKDLVQDNNVIFHIANSYATINSSKYHLNMVRNGFLMYGDNAKINNEMIINIHSRVVSIMNLKKGDTLGYDRTFKANRRMTIGVIPIGYADGLDRRLSNKFSLIVNDRMCNLVGLVCMDVCFVDITNKDVKLLDKVVLLGRSKNNIITLEDYAKTLNTSKYEILLKFNYNRMNYVLIK